MGSSASGWPGRCMNSAPEGPGMRNLCEQSLALGALKSRHGVSARIHNLSTPVGFEPTRGDLIGLAGRRLNHSAKVSCDWSQDSTSTQARHSKHHHLKEVGFPAVTECCGCCLHLLHYLSKNLKVSLCLHLPFRGRVAGVWAAMCHHSLPIVHHLGCSSSTSPCLTAVGFEPTPLRTAAWSQRLRPLGPTVLMPLNCVA